MFTDIKGRKNIEVISTNYEELCKVRRQGRFFQGQSQGCMMALGKNGKGQFPWAKLFRTVEEAEGTNGALRTSTGKGYESKELALSPLLYKRELPPQMKMV